jgi:tetratricopeptide (TPR) repeat protein
MLRAIFCIASLSLRGAIFMGAAVTFLMLSPTPASAQAVVNPALERAKGALDRGDVAEAERSIAAVAGNPYDLNDYDFVRGSIALAKSDYVAAIQTFRVMIERNPALNRVRLELARAYFLKGDDDVAAEHHFRAAMAQGVPPEVQVNIDGFLDKIRKRKHWDFSLSLALTPDTNINAGTSAQQVNLFGLPFELDNTARKTSGVGLALGVSGSYQADLTDQIKLRTGLGYYGTEYANSAYTDRNLNGYVGPRFLLGKGSEISVLAVGSRRWYGGPPLTYGVGARVEAQTELSPRILVGGNFGLQQLNYTQGFSDYTGPVYSANTNLIYAFDAISFVRASTGITLEQARLLGLRDTQYSMGLAYYREKLPRDFVATFAVQMMLVRYADALPAFGIARRDTQLDYRISLSNKRISLYGFTPVVSFVHTDRYSNINLFGFHRNRGEFGVTRNF